MRVQILQSNPDRLRNLIEAPAFLYADYPGGGATGMLVKDYRGKNGERESLGVRRGPIRLGDRLRAKKLESRRFLASVAAGIAIDPTGLPDPTPGLEVDSAAV